MRVKSRSNTNTWKILGVVILAGLLLVIFFYLKKDDKQEPLLKKQKALSYIPVITEVKIDPDEPTSTDDFIQALPQLKDRTMRHVKYQYRWFVNGDEVPGENKNNINKKYYRKGDTVLCRVKGVRGNRYVSKEVKSSKVKIKNSPPKVNLSMIGRFNVPGRFRYIINASDPDGDTLTYRLIEPLDLGIDIDPVTGEILWDIEERPKEYSEGEGRDSEAASGSEDEGASGEGEESRTRPLPRPVKKDPGIPPIVTIVFEVIDPDGGSVKASISLNLLEGGEVHE